jgi:hypothetical protein
MARVTKPVRRGRRAIAAAAVGLCVALVAAGCDVETAWSGNPSGKKVVVFGQQVTEISATKLHADLDATYQVRMAHASDVTSAQLASVGDAYASPVPDAVVIEMGTGDALKGVAPATTLAQVDALIAKFPAETCIILATNSEQGVTFNGNPYNNASAVAVNAGLQTRSDYVVDWGANTLDDGGYFRDPVDGITPTLDGQDYFTFLVSTKLSDCLVGEINT